MIHAELAQHAMSLRPLPGLDLFSLAKYHRTATCVMRRRKRDRTQSAALDILADTRQAAVPGIEGPVEKMPQGRRVDQASALRDMAPPTE